MSPSADQPASPVSPRPTVLLIDGDPANLNVISERLSAAGLEVLIARDGENGLQKARHALPHIILLGVAVPGLDGFEICRRLKADVLTKDIPVLFLTALTGKRDKLRAYEAGAVDIVTKPIQAEELLARVHTYLKLHSITQHLHEQDAQVQQAIAEREQAEVARQISEAQLRAIIEQLPFELWAMDDQLRYIVQNAASRKLFGDMVGKHLTDSPISELSKAKFLELDRRVLADEVLHDQYELEIAAQPRHYESILAPVKVDEAIVGLVGMAMDVTQRKQTEAEVRLYREHLEELAEFRTTELRAEIEERTRVQAELHQANRMLKLLSECNQVLVRASDEVSLLERICRLIVELGGYALAWVGLIEEAAAPKLRVAAHVSNAPAQAADFIKAQPSLEHEPLSQAIRSGQPCIVNDLQQASDAADWQDAALDLGYNALIVLPLKESDQVIGALSIYAVQPNAFYSEEVKLLLELVSDLTYGLIALRARAEQQRAETALAEQHRLLRILIEAMPDFIYIKDENSRFLLANKMVAWLMGTTVEEIIGKRDFDFYAHELAQRYYADEQALLTSGQALIDHEEPGRDLTGNALWLSTTKVPFRDEQGRIKGFVGIGRDITVRKEMELALRQARDELEARVAERTRELQQANDQLAGLYRIAQTMTAPLQLDVVLDIIARSTAQLIGSDTGAILLLDEAQETLTIAKAHGLSDDIVRGTRDRVGSSIAGRVVQTGQPIIANDLPHDERFYNPAAAHEGLLACASVPLMANGKIIGTLDVHSKTNPQAFTPDHIQILSMLASQAAIAIENARLYEDLQHAHAENEARYHILFEHANDALFLENEQDDILDVNPRACELLGYSRAELLNLKVPDLQPPEVRGKVGTVIKHELTHQGAVSESIDIRRDGTRIPVEISTSRVSDSGLVLAIVRDVTERKRAEAALRASEEKYRRIVDTAHEGVWVLDAARRTNFVNARLAQMLGYAPEELLGQPFEEFLFAEDRAEHRAEMAARRHGEPDQYERRMRHHDGSARWMLISDTPFFDEQHQFQGSFAMVADITERKRAEEKITQLNRDLEQRTSELAALNAAGRILASTLNLDQLLGLVMEQIKALVDAEAASVLLCVESHTNTAPPDLIFAAATGPAADKVLGTRMSGTVGIAGWVAQTQQPVQISDSQTDPRFYHQVDNVTGMTTHAVLAVPLIAKGTLVGVMEVINKRSGQFDAHDLEILEALSSSSAIAIENARLYASEQHRATALAHALERQRELDRLQREFIQNVSHELRTPIGLILGYAELLESGELGELQPEQREPVRIITRRTHMLRRLVEDITAILEIEAHARSGQRAALDLATLVRSAIDEFQIAAEKAHLTLAAEIAAEIPTLYGDAIALRRVLDNLLGNAFKFTPAGGRVAVRLWSEAQKAILQIRDTGIGIAAEKLGRIFDRFYQVDGSATRHYGGMGLGLALVKEIIEAHGGQIEAVSEINVGTTFTITLPVEEPSTLDIA